MKERTADSLLILAAAVWGSGFVGMDAVLDAGVPVNALLFLRFFLAGIFLCPILIYRRAMLSPKLVLVGLLCGVCLFAAYVFQTFALHYTTPAKNAFYTALYIIMVPFLCWGILRKRPHKFVFIALFPATLGITILSLRSFSDLAEFNFGDFLTIVCAFFFALQILLLGHYNRMYDPVLMTFFQILSTTLLAFFGSLFFETVSLSVFSMPLLMLILYLALGCTLFSFTVQNIAQKFTTQSRTAICMSSESVFGALFSILFGAEVFSFALVLGGGGILLGVLCVETKLDFLRFSRKKNGKHHEKKPEP